VAFFLGERAAAERISQRLFQRMLRPGEYAGLAGAPDDAKVEVGASGGKLYIELSDPLAAAYRAHYYLGRKESSLVLWNDGFHLHVCALRHSGLGLQIFCRQARRAAVLGVDRIEAIAGRRRDENGYYTWPRFGFDGPLPAALRQLLPASLNHAHTVLDLMECAAGRCWWRERGVTMRVGFELAAGSRSQRVLARYVHARLAEGDRSMFSAGGL
jgi:hypothetical protein